MTYISHGSEKYIIDFWEECIWEADSRLVSQSASSSFMEDGGLLPSWEGSVIDPHPKTVKSIPYIYNRFLSGLFYYDFPSTSGVASVLFPSDFSTKIL